MAFKFFVHDDDGKIFDKEFNRFCDAYDYAQDGLITFIYAINTDLPADEADEEADIIWSWDDTRDRESLLDTINAKYPGIQLESDSYDEKVDYISKTDLDLDAELAVKAVCPNCGKEICECQLTEAFEYTVQHENGRFVDKNYIVGGFLGSKPATFDSEEEAIKFISDDGKYPDWDKHFKIVKREKKITPDKPDYKTGSYVIKHYNGRFVSPDCIVGSFHRAAHFKTEEEAINFISDNGKWDKWNNYYTIVNLEDNKNATNSKVAESIDTFDDFDTQIQSDELEVPVEYQVSSEDWNQIMQELNTSKEIAIDSEDIDDLTDDEFLEAFGKALKDKHNQKS